MAKNKNKQTAPAVDPKVENEVSNPVVTSDAAAPVEQPQVSVPQVEEKVSSPVVEPPVVAAPDLSEEITLEILKTDEVSRNFTYYTKSSVLEAIKSFRHDATLPVVLFITDYDKKDLIFLRKEKIQYNEATGILTITVPRKIVQQAPGYHASLHAYVERTRDIRGNQDSMTRVIDNFYFHEIVLTKTPNGFKNLKSVML